MLYYQCKYTTEGVLSMQEIILFGTYTRKTSNGIYQAVLDTEAKAVSTPELFLNIQNPTYLQLNSKKTLLTVASQDSLGGVASYNYSNKSFFNDVFTEGANPCYVSIDEPRGLVYSANYHKGQIDVFKLNVDQTLTLTDSFKNTGNGPLPEQDSAHMHYANLTSDGRLVAVDLGSDQLHVFNVSDNGKLSNVSVFKLPAGFGPRHLVFSPNKKNVYLVGELSSNVATLNYDESTGSFNLVDIIKTIPTSWTEHNGAAAIRISNDGKFVYVSNRGHNSLAVFAVQADNTLELVQLISTEGDFPRDFALDKSEKFVVVANQNTDNATLYSRNELNGQLSLLQKDISVPEGVCVNFI